MFDHNAEQECRDGFVSRDEWNAEQGHDDLSNDEPAPIDVGTVEVYVNFTPEYFNRVCMATIPATWRCEIINITPEFIEAVDGRNTEYAGWTMYEIANTREEVIEYFIDQLQKLNLTGSLIVRE